MDREGGKSLSGPLAETDVAETLRPSDVENVIDGIRDVVPGKVIHGIIPKLLRIWVVPDALFGVLVTSVVPQPDIKPKVDQDKGESAIR
jgi:hypothetical protein